MLQFSTSGSPLSQPRSKENKRLTQDEDSDSHQQDAFACKNHLNPFSSRRVSSVTCSSADSSYLERRCSAFEVGLPAAPYYFRESREKLLSKHEEPWDYYYPIDIQVPHNITESLRFLFYFFSKETLYVGRLNKKDNIYFTLTKQFIYLGTKISGI